MTVISDIRLYCVHYCLIYVKEALWHKSQKCQRVLSVVCPRARKHFPHLLHSKLSSTQQDRTMISKIRMNCVHYSERCSLTLISKLSESTLRSVYTGDAPTLDIYFTLRSQVDTCSLVSEQNLSLIM